MPDYAVFEEIFLTQDEVLECSFSAWYPRLKKYCHDAVILKPLPKSFLHYLSSESIKLPDSGRIENNSDNEYSDWESESEDMDESGVKADGSESDQNEHVEGSAAKIRNSTIEDFPELHQQILAALTSFKDVLPKLNWSAPKDAKWIAAGNTMKCHIPNDIYLLLNASDHIADDLDTPFSEVSDKNVSKKEVEYELVLKKWEEINPALEFRIYIKDKKVIGVSQRDLNHFKFLHEIKENLNQIIDTFVVEVIEKMPIDKFIIDVYIPRSFKEVYIIDINPFSRKSDSLLFTWNELLNSTGPYEFRLVNETNVGRFATKEYSESQVPLEVVDAGTNGGASMVELAREWQKLQMKSE